ncbi:unnamed protein product [Effrenium voratum]|uniref:Profilin n=2 Tax=Effrenium voratum TaxID=2562239 RepID=A0AA36I765_9DINO|nr:unnamed protein product [Effrenium voratum]CAJ1419306.1 unnamed protein product [Effrenium voratum]
MAEEEGSWDSTLDEWLISEGFCYSAGMAQLEDGAFYAAAPEKDEAGWGFIYKEDHEQMITQEDMTEKKMTITEATSLKYVADNLKAPPTGLWLGGQKYSVTRVEKEFQVNETTFTYIFANRPKKASTSGLIAMCAAGRCDRHHQLPDHLCVLRRGEGSNGRQLHQGAGGVR